MIVLGCTGSIGVNALKIARQKNIRVNALACGANIKLLNEQIAIFKPSFVCISDKSKTHLVNHKVCFSEEDGLKKLIKESNSSLVLNAITGFAGLKPSIYTQKLGKDLALANKESLVVAGSFLTPSKILPIDSEHCALKALLSKKQSIKKLFITSSGGAFYNTPLNELKHMKAADALRHPNWNMGDKITINSATMMNKLFEILEAFWLFNTKNIDAVIEHTSIIHALCEFNDASMSAYLSQPDMLLSIASAIIPDYNEALIKPLDLCKLAPLSFDEICLEKYPIFGLKDEVLSNPSLGVIINAANEVLVDRFLRGEIGFLDISKGVFEIVDKFGGNKISSLEDVFAQDSLIRTYMGEK